MRSVAPRDSSTSLPHLSQTRMVFFAIPGSLRSGARRANSPGTQQAQCRLLFDVETDISRADDPQMARPEILDRSPVEILLDDRRAHVGRTCDRGCVSELLGDTPHHGGNSPLCLGRIVRRLVRRELRRGEQGAAPGPEVLGGVAVAEVSLHVVVQLPLAEIAI